MIEPTANYRTTKPIIRLFQLSRSHLECINQESAIRNVTFAPFVIQLLAGNPPSSKEVTVV
jgi:hypothetical protein